MVNRRYSVAPFCATPLASPDDYLRLWNQAKAQTSPVVDAYEQACGAAIDREWLDRLALLTQVVIKKSAIEYQHGRLLYATLRRYARDHVSRHLNIVETGTARGFSSLCLAKALEDAGATGKVLTFDVLPHDERIYWNCLRDARGPSTRAELLEDYRDLLERYVVFLRGDSSRELQKLAFPRVHLMFFDSVHTHAQVTAEFAAIRGRQRRGDLLVFDDYTPEAYPGVVKAADEICAAAGYTRLVVSVSARRGYLIAEKQ